MKCIENEIPFEVPEGWAWCRFTSVTVNRDSERKPISSANRTNVAKIYDYYGASGKIDKIDKFIFNEKLLLIGEDGANLVTRSKPIAFFAEGQYWVNNHAHCIDSTDKLILEYLCLYINAISLEKYVTGSAQPKMTQDNMNSILIALPPYEEQKRLEFQVNHILKTVSTIENEKEDIVNYISSAKSKILDLAIRGKLVPQNPNAEPASVLLERIRAEKEELIKAGKIKRDKKESIIFRGEDNSYYEKIGDKIRCIDAEIPFDLPELWTFARLKHIGGIVGGGTPKTNIGKYWDGNIPWLTPADLSGYDSMYISTGSRTITDFGLKSSSAQMLPANSILYSSRAPIGYTAIATNPVCTNQGFKSVVPYDFSISPYLYYSLKARTDNIIQRATGTTFKEISGSEMAETIIPIPPLNEQSKIVEKVTQLQEVISLIEKSLN
ncbi:MAG: restriction endonuclease subunit S [Clostridium sp.]